MMSLPIRVDFYDLRDLQGGIYSIFSSSFRHPHIGIMIDDVYLLPMVGRKTEWCRSDVIVRMMSGRDRLSFTVHGSYDESLVFMAGDGHVITSRTWNTITELPSYLADVGFRIPRFRRTTCATIASSILRAAGLEVQATTARHLYEELRAAARFGGSGPLVEADVPAHRELEGGRPA